MKIAIDSGPLTSGHKVRGVGFYTQNLIDNLGDKIEAVDFQNADLSKYDLIHYPYFSLFQNNLHLVKKNKFVVTIHDLIPLIYPKNYPPGIRGKINFWLQKFAVCKADAIITDTETSKKDIVRFLGISPEKIHVVYLAPGKNFRKIADSNFLDKVRAKYNLPKKFVLYVGDVNYNKNIPVLIKACKLADLPLVLVGKQALEIENLDLNHPELVHLNEVVKDLKSKNIIRLGFVPDEDIVAVYNLASVYCQPSLYEGFGLPVLQAVACGIPVVASRTQALVEIAGEAATFVEPDSPNQFVEAFENLKSVGQLPRKYSWDKTADETYSIYKQVLL